MPDSEFSLDTKSHDEAASYCRKLASEMKRIKKLLDTVKDNTLDVWKGRGSNAFKSKYHVFIQELADISDELNEMAETIYFAESQYIQVDVDMAKQLEGITKY